MFNVKRKLDMSNKDFIVIIKITDKEIMPFSKSITIVTCLKSKFPYRKTVVSLICISIYLC